MAGKRARGEAPRAREQGVVREAARRVPRPLSGGQDADRIVGVVFGTHDQRKGWINRLAVLPAYRGRGVAKALVWAAEEAIRGHDIEILAALVEPDNAASLGLFRALGYRTDVPVVYFRKPSSPEA